MGAENEAYWAENDPYPDYDDLTPEEQRTRDAVEAARARWEQRQREDREFARQERLAEAAATKADAPTPTKAQGTPLSAVVDRWAANQNNQKTIDRMKLMLRLPRSTSPMRVRALRVHDRKLGYRK
jgi:hypothetical protein